LAFCGGFLLVHRTTRSDNRQLLRDLPVIERMDEYRYGDSVEFLHMLDREGLFTEDELEHDL
jgi:hypothetical protein